MADRLVTGVAEGAFVDDFSRSMTDRASRTILSRQGKLSQMVMFAQSQTLSKGDPFVARALNAADATAAPVVDKNKLLL
jgi:hypothetical protein